MFKNKKVIVTAGTDGIGRAIVDGFIEGGAKVAVCARSDNNLALLKEKHGDQILVKSADLLDPNNAKSFVQEVVTEWGKVDHFVFNPPHVVKNTIAELSLSDWQKSFNGIFQSMVSASDGILTSMKEHRQGTIVVVSSLVAVEPLNRLAASSVLRGSVAGWVKLMAGEYGPYGIRVNAIQPGYTDTNAVRKGMEKKAVLEGKTPEQVTEEFCQAVGLRRLAQPSEIADGVLYLSSDQSSFVTGTNLLVDGGLVRGV